MSGTDVELCYCSKYFYFKFSLSFYANMALIYHFVWPRLSVL